MVRSNANLDYVSDAETARVGWDFRTQQEEEGKRWRV